mmetsp:Transcript_86651/g.269330  ORF Transcript_86651/g.269330 Transcript_86651/m.269330 type:complete len:349 (-) Transcript_86651:96-1142(-)
MPGALSPRSPPECSAKARLPPLSVRAAPLLAFLRSLVELLHDKVNNRRRDVVGLLGGGPGDGPLPVLVHHADGVFVQVPEGIRRVRSVPLRADAEAPHLNRAREQVGALLHPARLSRTKMNHEVERDTLSTGCLSGKQVSHVGTTSEAHDAVDWRLGLQLLLQVGQGIIQFFILPVLANPPMLLWLCPEVGIKRAWIGNSISQLLHLRGDRDPVGHAGVVEEFHVLEGRLHLLEAGRRVVCLDGPIRVDQLDLAALHQRLHPRQLLLEDGAARASAVQAQHAHRLGALRLRGLLLLLELRQLGVGRGRRDVPGEGARVHAAGVPGDAPAGLRPALVELQEERVELGRL